MTCGAIFPPQSLDLQPVRVETGDGIPRQINALVAIIDRQQADALAVQHLR